MTINFDNIESIFNSYVFKNVKQRSKATTYKNGNKYIYLLPNKTMTIILNPEIVESNEYLLETNNGLYHNSALIEFPKRVNDGKKEIHYGYKFMIKDSASFKAILNQF